MGVRGLSTYVASLDRGDLFQDFQLRNCTVVIGTCQLSKVQIKTHSRN